MAFDNTSFLATYGATATVSHAVASGSNRRLYVFVNYDGSGDKVTGVTYGGVSMTRIGYSATNFRIVVYELVDPAVGTANVVCTFTSSGSFSVGVVSCSDATASAVTFAVNGYANSPWSQSATAVAGDLLVDFIGTSVLDIANAFVPGAGQTQDELYNAAGGMWAMSHKSAASSGSVALTNSWSGGAQKSITSALLLITGAGDPPAIPVFSGTIPAKTGTAGAAFDWGTPSLASYFTGSGITYTVSTVLSAIGLSIDGSTGVISGTGTTGTWTGTVTATNVDGSDTSNSFTITISAAPADLSAPTVTSVGATTATCGFSTDTATGNGYFLRRTGLSAASAATIISTGENQAISGTGAQTRAMTGFTSGLTYYVDMAQTGSTEVVTAGPFYPGTGRPVSDVDVTGWTASTGSDLWAMLDEDTASDADYVTSPALSGSATTGSHALDKTYTAGTYSIKVRAKTDTGAGTLAVRLLNGSNVSQGVTADQAITSTWTTYTLAITTTGDATRIRYEVVAA